MFVVTCRRRPLQIMEIKRFSGSDIMCRIPWEMEAVHSAERLWALPLAEMNCNLSHTDVGKIPSSPCRLCTRDPRALQGRPLGRLAVKQWWTPTTDPQAVRDQRGRWEAALQGVFPAARQYVEVVEIAEGDDILPFTLRDAWNVDGAEAKYDPPPQWPTAREK
ncbi:hypothetical protein VTO73DRAFT_8004 [Trametes versicolor]